MTNCLYEAALQKIRLDCDCTPAFFTTLLADPDYPPKALCEGAKRLCMSKIMEDIGTQR